MKIKRVDIAIGGSPLSEGLIEQALEEIKENKGKFITVVPISGIHYGNGVAVTYTRYIDIYYEEFEKRKSTNSPSKGRV